MTTAIYSKNAAQSAIQVNGVDAVQELPILQRTAA